MENVVLRGVVPNFREGLQSVHRLMRFDQVILDILAGALRTIHERQEKATPRLNERHAVKPALSLLDNIRNNDSLRPQYESMFNQCLVLSVSHFESAARDLYIDSVQHVLERDRAPFKLANAHIDIRIGDLATAGWYPRFVGEWLAQSGISFQDMKSIRRAFHEHCGVTVDRDENVNDIILAQACRHAILHNRGLADERFVKQVSSAVPRTVMLEVTLGGEIQFTPPDIERVGDSMCSYLRQIITGLIGEHEDLEPADLGV